MSFKIAGQIWDLDLPHGQAWVLMAMVDHADHTGANIHPSVGLISWKTGYSERQIQRIIKELLAAKILFLDSERGGRTRCYRVDLSTAPRKAPFKKGAGKNNSKGDMVSPPRGDMVSPPRGDMVSPPRGDMVSPLETIGGCHGVTVGGDTAMSPSGVTQLCHPHYVEPPVEPPVEPERETRTRHSTIYESEKSRAERFKPDALSAAILKVCDMPPDCQFALSKAQAEQLAKVHGFVLAQCGGDVASAASEITQRFAPGVWPMNSPPRLSQIATDWNRQGQALANGTALAVNGGNGNGTHRNGGSGFSASDKRAAAHIAEFENIAAERERLAARRRELAEQRAELERSGAPG